MSAFGYGLGAVRVLGAPSSELFRQIAQVGTGLFIAYSVAITAIVKAFVAEVDEPVPDGWLGYLVGVGSCGLVGMGIALALSEHRDAGHDNLLDAIGFGWVLTSTALLGLAVAGLPVLISRSVDRE